MTKENYTRTNKTGLSEQQENDTLLTEAQDIFSKIESGEEGVVSYEEFFENTEVVIKDFDHFQELVIKWADERDMFCPDNGATVGSQFAKLMEEIGKLGKGLLEKDKEQIKDVIGDCAVVLVNIAKLRNLDWSNYMVHRAEVLYSYADIIQGVYSVYSSLDLPDNHVKYFIEGSRCSLESFAGRQGLDFMDCCQHAYNTIKDRKGKMIDGKFVREAE